MGGQSSTGHISSDFGFGDSSFSQREKLTSTAFPFSSVPLQFTVRVFTEYSPSKHEREHADHSPMSHLGSHQAPQRFRERGRFKFKQNSSSTSVLSDPTQKTRRSETPPHSSEQIDHAERRHLQIKKYLSNIILKRTYIDMHLNILLSLLVFHLHNHQIQQHMLQPAFELGLTHRSNNAPMQIPSIALYMS